MRPGPSRRRSILPERRRRTILVSPFPPLRDGIGRYAQQLAESLESEGEPVVRVGSPGSDADEVVSFTTGIRLLRLLRIARRGDAVRVMWHPTLYVAGRQPARVLSYAALGVVCKTRTVSLVVHEMDDRLGQGVVGISALRFRLEERVRGWMFGQAREICFHSHAEAAKHARAVRYGRGCPAVRVIEHAAHMKPHRIASRKAARAALRLRTEPFVFVCIGFLAWHKGFDAAVTAFAVAQPPDSELHVVGSVRPGGSTDIEYLRGLRELSERTAGACLHETFVDDVTFDLWLQAADCVILPYRAISSSSVAARAGLFGTPRLLTRVGALPEQADEGDEVVDSAQDLAAAISRIVARGSRRAVDV